ncbi:2Fe-2S iron-sulfur cluster-binding protein [Streptomyces sp. NBC_00878]|uniref:2Fe-2S iron-sulfur cluster-binding protein n=1 Tax=Streptomyces sp. NBC_00878 TaxID=2975854 RepID=UPI002256161D|nr:2Fe-2S iron-sulfur cluster-binding protein [Streptomyces sp. NBC_00878]MCX4908318.1 2Fe-2S iron-sulfur cluster-binding protein [Streptomyces sp. NBC_00878]
MTDDQHGEGTPRTGSRWDPLPQGDYDDGATAFVKLPEGGIDALLADSPLAAPGHGYVPPPITVAPATDEGTDPAAPGPWGAPPQGPEGGQPQAVQWPDPNALPEEHRQHAQDAFAYNPGSTGQWTFDEPPQGGQGAPGQDVTGQWSIPVANGDLPDESGEFSTSSLVEQWGGTPPATLPGGAAAPWASEPWAQQPSPDQPSPAEEAVAHAEHGTVEHDAAEIIDVSGEHADEIAVSVDREESMREGTMRAEPAEASSGHGPPERAGEPGDEPGAPSPEERAAARADTADATEESAADDTPSAPAHNDHPLASYVLRVNGVERPVTDAWIGESLLYVLRERLGLAGAKDGCSQGECGACNVQVDGRLVASCLVPAVTAAGSEVRTVEGLAADGQPSDVQRALAKCGAVQCGFCVPGMAMTVHDLLEGNPAPTELETRQALCGNLCRCSGYRGVLNAVRDVVAEREAHASGDNATDAAPSADARIPHQAGPGAGSVNPSAFESPQPHQQPHQQSYGQDGGQA